MRGRAKFVHDPLAREIPAPLAHVDHSLTTVLGIGLEQVTGWHYWSLWPAQRGAVRPQLAGGALPSGVPCRPAWDTRPGPAVGSWRRRSAPEARPGDRDNQLTTQRSNPCLN